MRRNPSPGPHPKPATDTPGKPRHPSPDDMVCQGFRMDAVTKALWHLKAALDLLRQPFETNEIAALIDLITSLNQEKARLESRSRRT